MIRPSEKRSILNPFSKLAVVLFLGVTLLRPLDDKYSLFIVLVFAVFYCLYNMPIKGLKTTALYISVLLILGSGNINELHPFFKMFASVLVVVKIFYLPVMAGKFFLLTSEVGSIISSMDKLKIPTSFSIPISVMFRFFPSFREEHANIKMAMKVRGITAKKPLRYLEYVAVPLLILSSNLTDDIAKAAETKCIADPAKKVRYRYVGFGVVDIFFIALMLVVRIVGSA